VISDILDLWQLVVMRQQHRVALLGKRTHFRAPGTIRLPA
jgi:hypothetical protein